MTRRLLVEFVRRPRPADTADRLGVLTERERDVPLRLGRGLWNAEIVAGLYLGAATVKTHVRDVLAEPGLRDRVRVVAFAYETRADPTR